MPKTTLTFYAFSVALGRDQGMGAQPARRFAKPGLHAFVAGRTSESLAAVANSIVAAGGVATPVVADATSEAATVALFAQARAQGAIDLVTYNTGNNTPGRLEDMSAEYFENSWRVCCFGGSSTDVKRSSA